jgi:hypothetical protein
MPIRTMPFDVITAGDIEDLVTRQLREDRTLDFKETLDLGDSGRIDFFRISQRWPMRRGALSSTAR